MLLVIAACGATIAQQRPEAATSTTSAPTTDAQIEDLHARLRQLEQLKDIDAAARESLGEAYRNAIDRLKAARAWHSKSARYESLRAGIPAVVARLKQELATSQPAVSIQPATQASLTQIEQLQAEAQNALGAARKLAGDAEAEPARRTARRVTINREFVRIADAIAGIDKELAAPPGDVAPELYRARRIHLEATRQSFENQVTAFRNELAYYDAAIEPAALERESAARKAHREEQVVALWQAAVSAAQARESRAAEQQAREAREVAGRAHPSVRAIAEENVRLADEKNELTKLDAAVGDELQAIKTVASKVTKDFERLKARFDAAGSRNVGVYLIKQRRELPDSRAMERAIARRKQEVSRVQLRALQLSDDRAELDDITERVTSYLRDLDEDIPEPRRNAVAAYVEQALREQRTRLDELNVKYDYYFQKLLELDAKQAELVRVTETVREYIVQRVLWTRSDPPYSVQRVVNEAPAVAAWFCSSEIWSQIRMVIAEDTARHWPVWALATIGIGVLGLSSRRLRHRLTEIAGLITPIESDRFALTIEALFITGLITLLPVAPFAFVGWRLVDGGEGHDVARAIGFGLLTTILALLPAEFMRQSCRRGGLADAHFRWRSRNLRLVRRHLLLLMLVVVPMAFISSALIRWGHEPWVETIVRTAFLFRVGALAIFVQRLLRPRGGILEEHLQRHRNRLSARFVYVWYPVLVALPVAQAVAAVMGFHYTAQYLSVLIYATICLIFGSVLLNALLLRWIFVAHRRLATDEARKRRESAGAGASGASVPAASEPVVDLSSVNVQTRKLLRTLMVFVIVFGGWTIWQEVLPTLGFLNVELWSRMVKVPVEVSATADDSSDKITQWVDRSVPVTVMDLMLAIVALAVTWVAAGNVPGLLEISVLRRLPFEPGGRYAVTTIVRYVITVTGIVSACGLIGIGWSNVQWLVAAVTVGLGFGLQEIFANFVSGLIILFERPVRVGDVVTVGPVTGTVTRIRIRATTVRDADRKELLVPNKQFITDRIVNWTLSDRVTRIVIAVGVDFGTDVEKVRRILLDAAAAQPGLLPSPEPSALFLGFGESVLNFELSAFVASPDSASAVKHALNVVILNQFNAAGIPLSPPRRELMLPGDGQAVPVIIRRERGKAADTDARP